MAAGNYVCVAEVDRMSVSPLPPHLADLTLMKSVFVCAQTVFFFVLFQAHVLTVPIFHPPDVASTDVDLCEGHR